MADGAIDSVRAVGNLGLVIVPEFGRLIGEIPAVAGDPARRRRHLRRIGAFENGDSVLSREFSHEKPRDNLNRNLLGIAAFDYREFFSGDFQGIGRP